MSDYINDIRRYVRNDVNYDMIIDIIQTDRILNRWGRIFHTYSRFYKESFLFEKRASCLNSFFQRVNLDYSAPMYLLIKNADYCGVYIIKGLSDFNHNFDWHSNGGLISLLSEDYSSMILIEWYNRDNLHLMDVSLRIA